MFKDIKYLGAIFSAILLSYSISLAENEEAPGREDAKRLQRITVTGGADKVDETTGSAYFLEGEELERALRGHDDINRALRQIPGVNVVDEEGYGLRPNIGFRGVSTERSSNITLMEDGVLIAPAPYSAPAAYYFPTFGRMEGVEVLKGAGQIKYGPRTTGGSLNLLSTSIPSTLSLNADVRLGQHDTRIAHLNLGNSYKNLGWMLETYQGQSNGFKRLDGVRKPDTGYDIQDYVGKFRINSDSAAEFYQELELKVGIYDQLSRETYLGLTDQDFSRDHRRRYAASQRDEIDVDHSMYNLTHYIELGPIDLTTTLYRNDTDRNWYKLQSVAGVGLAPILDNPDLYQQELAWIRGENSPDGALVVRENKRAYLSQGVQTALGHEFVTGPLEHSLEFGMRYHEDEEDRFQQEDGFRMENGSMVLTSQGAPGSHDNRIGSAKAWAFYLQDRVSIDRLTLVPGLRYENISYRRENFGKNDPQRTGLELTENRNRVDVFIPGIGAGYELSDNLTAFAGIHRGFAPPGPTTSAEVKEEKSVNYELGGRYRKNSLRSEVTFFFNDYSNLLGADTLAAGGFGTGDLFNAGRSRSYGVEALARYNLLEEVDAGFTLPLRANYTYTVAEFRTDFVSDLFGVVDRGDNIPYIPQHQASLGAGVEVKKLGLYVDAYYADAMPTVAGGVGLESKRTDSYFVTDLTGEYELAKGTKLYATVQNLFDNEYIVARRPAGARPGMPRTVFAGLKFNF
jgi:Fe(3+) dicitrate transport protein